LIWSIPVHIRLVSLLGVPMLKLHPVLCSLLDDN
jgi:hypothetical protein